MTTLRIVPIEPEHLKALDIGDAIANLRLPGRAWALLEDDKPIAAGGIVIMHAGVGMVWTNISECCRRSARVMRRIHFVAREYIERCKEEYRLDRIQTDTLADDPGACNWPARFGFEDEGVMRKYYEGKDYRRFAWIRD